MNKILYRPKLGIQKKYQTDGHLNYSDTNIGENTLEEQKIEQLVDIANQILSIKETSALLPQELSKVVDTMINTLEFIFVQIDPDYITGEVDKDGNLVEDDPDIVVTKPEKEDDGPSWLSSSVPNIMIKSVPKNKIKAINKLYSGTLLEIVRNYINEFKNVTSQYFMDFGMLLKHHDKSSLTFIEKKYSYKTTDLKNKDFHHISDFIIKSEIIREQKQRMMNKLINEEESLNKIKACEAARELSIRYENEKLGENNTYEYLFSNLSLKESKLQYKEKMNNNLYELYKYLNSSVILLDECLRLYIREAQAKSILVKEEGIKI